MLSLGLYPDVSLATARDRRDAARKMVASGRDPSVARTLERTSNSNTLESIAREWFAVRSTSWASSHSSKVIGRLENDVFPWLGNRPINSIDAPELLQCLRRVDARGATDTARRIRQYCSGIFRYAIATSRASRDVAADLRDAIRIPTKSHFRSVTDSNRLGQLLRAIDAYQGTFVVRTSLALLPHVFVRPGELRGARWNEIDFKKALWTIPPERRKLRHASKGDAEPHLVPLSAQAVAMLKDLRPVTEKSGFLFPSELDRTRPMSDGALNKALRTLGFGDEAVAHGFRHTASTLLHELGFESQWIERQLSHVDSNVIRGTYNRARFLDERRNMMQSWSDHLDRLRLC